MDKHDIIVIGASWDGIANVSAILSELPSTFEGSLFVVIHIAPESPNLLASILQKKSKLPVETGAENMPIQRGRVYVAVADKHLVIERERIRVFRGPRENRWRPAIDPLFRSAAVAFGSRVVGVILGGLLDDGSSGLAAVKRCGGVTIVQEPSDATYANMPVSALRLTTVDHVVPVSEMGELITRISEQEISSFVEVPESLKMEVSFMSPDFERPSAEKLGPPASVSCPECGGPLHFDENSNKHYRCIVGHAFSSESFSAEQQLAYERALWSAVRMLEERTNLMNLSARRERSSGREKSAGYYEEMSVEAHRNAALLRRLLFKDPEENLGTPAIQ